MLFAVFDIGKGIVKNGNFQLLTIGLYVTILILELVSKFKYVKATKLSLVVLQIDYLAGLFKKYDIVS